MRAVKQSPHQTRHSILTSRGNLSAVQISVYVIRSKCPLSCSYIGEGEDSVFVPCIVLRNAS